LEIAFKITESGGKTKRCVSPKGLSVEAKQPAVEKAVEKEKAAGAAAEAAKTKAVLPTSLVVSASTKATSSIYHSEKIWTYEEVTAWTYEEVTANAYKFCER